MVEVAARSIGGLCSKALTFKNEITLEDIILRQAVGQDISDIQRERQAAAVMMIPIATAGVLKRVGNIIEAKAVAGVEDVIISIAENTAVEPMPQGGRYL